LFFLKGGVHEGRVRSDADVCAQRNRVIGCGKPYQPVCHSPLRNRLFPADLGLISSHIYPSTTIIRPPPRFMICVNPLVFFRSHLLPCLHYNFYWIWQSLPFRSLRSLRRHASETRRRTRATCPQIASIHRPPSRRSDRRTSGRM